MSVMSDFEKIAAEQGWITTNFNPKDKDFVGNPSTSPVGPFRYSPDGPYFKHDNKEYDVTKETGKELIELAHKKSPTMAPSMGKGGLVENQVEQQEHDIEVASRMPSGALVQIHAFLVNELIKTANELEDAGKIEQAEKIDDVIARLINRPFQAGRP